MARIVKLVAGVDEEAEAAAAAKPKSWAEQLERTYASVGEPEGWAAALAVAGCAGRAAWLLRDSGWAAPGPQERCGNRLDWSSDAGRSSIPGTASGSLPTGEQLPPVPAQAPPLPRAAAGAVATAAAPHAARWSA